MFTFRIGWTTLSLKFLDKVTFSLTSSPEKKHSDILHMQHEKAYTLQKKEQNFSSWDQLWFSVFVLIFSSFSSFPSLLPLYSSQTGYYFTSNLNEAQICGQKCCTSFQIHPAFRRPTSAKFKPPQQNSPSCLCSAASFASLLSSNTWVAISSLARFEVITKMASLHTIVFPCPSVKRPWIKNRGFFFHQNLKRSKTTNWKIFKPSMTQKNNLHSSLSIDATSSNNWSMTVKTSGWAFST